jgi:hypothetical protein
MNHEQLQTILWLRWRLMRNQWARHGWLGAVLAVLAGLGALVTAAGGFLGALLGAAFKLGAASPKVILLVWLAATVAFLFFWLLGLLGELQRSEMIDLPKLMHLPVALRQLFVVNYLVSHFTPSIIIMVPIMLGLATGLMIARGPEMALLIPLALSMVLMITAWTYCLRGWLAALMSNPRRRRTVIMLISFSFIVIAQGPNLYFNILGRRALTVGGDRNLPRNGSEAASKMFSRLAEFQSFIPPLWVPVGAQGLAEQRAWPAVYGTLGCLGLAILGLRQAYRNSFKFYQGDTGGRPAARRKPAGTTANNARVRNRRAGLLEWQLPGVPEQSAALALATFRSLLRAPEVKMALGTSTISVLFVGAMVVLRSPPVVTDAAKPFIATAVVALSTFILSQFFTNQFGFDRDGFRSLMLSPADRRLILLGKNLAILPIGASFGLISLVLVAGWLHLPPAAVAAATFQLFTLILIASLAGNLLSILSPYRIQPGTMRPAKMPGLAMFFMFLFQMLQPLALAPVFMAPLLGWLWQRGDLPSFVPVNLICSGILCAMMVLIYWLALMPLGRLLQRRETKILNLVTVEVE